MSNQAPDTAYCVGNARTVYLASGERYQDARKASLCALIVEADPFQRATGHFYRAAAIACTLRHVAS